MGEACAGAMANMYLYTYEREFMKRLVDTRQEQLLRKFLFVKRYIDDIGAFNVPVHIHR